MRNFALACPLVFPAWTTLVGWNSLVDLEKTSDLIAVGRATAVSASGDVLTVQIILDRVLKGDLTSGSTLSADCTWPSSRGFSPAQESLPKGPELWFLQKTPARWKLLPAVQNGLSFSDTGIPVPAGPLAAPYRYTSGAPTSDKIASEVSAALEARTVGLLATQLPLLLDQLHSLAAAVLYRRQAASPDEAARIDGLAGLIRNGDTAALEQARVANLAGHPVQAGFLKMSFRDSFRNTDAQAIATVAQFALSPGQLREEAAFVLRAIHTKETLPSLATLLDDPDVKMRIEAVGGFSSFANGMPVQTQAGVPNLQYLQPSENGFKTPETMAHFAMGEAAVLRDEANLLAYWKAWWARHRAALGY